ncbi:MAG: HPr family phosphocarrier protein [Eubacteriales bacterium]|nr:HPr family phosphocarrier protein [Eubacteriales bacterium]
MKQFTYTIQDELGIHARPAGLLTKEAAKFKSTVSVEDGGKKGDAKKIMSLMMLGAKKGHTITVTVEGEDEDAAASAIQTFLQENL